MSNSVKAPYGSAHESFQYRQGAPPRSDTLSRRLQDAEIKAREARHALDRRLYLWREDGSSVTDLSLDAGISQRDRAVIRSIERFKAELASQGLAETAR